MRWINREKKYVLCNIYVTLQTRAVCTLCCCQIHWAARLPLTFCTFRKEGIELVKNLWAPLRRLQIFPGKKLFAILPVEACVLLPHFQNEFHWHSYKWSSKMCQNSYKQNNLCLMQFCNNSLKAFIFYSFGPFWNSVSLAKFSQICIATGNKCTFSLLPSSFLIYLHIQPFVGDILLWAICVLECQCSTQSSSFFASLLPSGMQLFYLCYLFRG